MELLVVFVRLLAGAAIVYGLLAIVAVRVERPRARRPELAPILYVQAAGVVAMGVAILTTSFLLTR